MPVGGLFWLLEQKLVSKVIKTGFFAYSAANGGQPPPPRRVYATAFSRENQHFSF